MLVTNHLLSPKFRTDEPDSTVGNTGSKSWWRYEVAEAYLNERNGVLSPEQVQECLGLVHWDNLVLPNGKTEVTQYTNVYNQSALTLWLRPWNEYDTTYHFELK